MAPLSRYVGPLLGNKTHGVLTNPAGVFAGEFYAEPGRIRWGTSIEHWRTRDCDGVSYAWVDGYENGVNGDFYAVESVVSRVNGKNVPCTDGSPFGPLTLGPGVTVVEQWFLMWSADHTASRPGYWKGTLTTGTRQNPCTGETLPVVILHEVWWDDAAGWVRGNAKTLPWANGAPAEVEANAIGETTFALDKGVWTVSDAPGSVICLHSLTPW